LPLHHRGVGGHGLEISLRLHHRGVDGHGIEARLREISWRPATKSFAGDFTMLAIDLFLRTRAGNSPHVYFLAAKMSFGNFGTRAVRD
jgi:hypothetical protein